MARGGFVRTPRVRPLSLLFAMAAFGAASAIAQQTVTLIPSVPKIVAGANFTQVSTNLYIVPIVVTFAGGNSQVDFAVSGAPAGAVATVVPAALTNSGLVQLRVELAGVAKGVYPLTVTASGGATATTVVDFIAGQLWVAPTNVLNGFWSAATNWSTGVATTTGDHVKFEDAGAVSNIVDTSIAVESLSYARFVSSATNNTIIPAGTTLSVLGTGGFSANVESTNGNNKQTTINILGPGKLVVSNAAANFSVNALNAGGSGTRFSMQSLNEFTAEVNRFGLGDVTLAQQGGWGQQLVQVFLARTNVIRAGFVGAYDDLENTNSITIFNNSERFNNGSANNVDLGLVNVFEGDSVTISKNSVGSANNIVRFNPAFLTSVPRPSVSFRGTNGSRMTLFNIGVPSGGQNVAANSQATLDMRGGTLNLLVDSLVLGANRLRYTNMAGNTFGRGTVVFNDGTLAVNVARLGWQRHTNDAYARGAIAVGGTGVLVVNDAVELGLTSGGDPITGDFYAEQTFGQIIVTNGGTARLNRVTVGQISTNNNITLAAGGNVIISNTVASPERALSVLDMANSALTLHINGNTTNVFVTTLVCGGLQNVINIASVSVTGPYPVQVSLISYVNTPSQPNIALGTMPPGLFGYVFNNTAKKTIDLVISTNVPRTLVWRGNINGNWDTNTANWLDAATLASTPFANGDFVRFDDSATGTTSVNLIGPLVVGQAPGVTGLAVSNSTLSYTFGGAGKVVGATLTVKQGSGSLTINASTESPISATEGAILGNGSLSAITVQSNAAMAFNGSINGPVVSAGSSSLAGTLTGSLTIQSGTFTNSGTVTATVILQSGSLYNLATMNVLAAWTAPAGFRLVNSGAIVQSGSLTLAGILTGNGSISSHPDVTGDNSRVSVGSGATFSPGDSIGRMAINTRLDMNAGSTNIFEIDLTAGTNDVVLANTVNFGGQIVVTNIGTTPFNGGERFQLFVPAFGANVPNNANVSPFFHRTPGLGMIWLTNTAPNFLRTNGFVGVLRVANTTPTNIVVMRAGNELTLSWPSSHIGWRLQAQTNSLSVGISTNWVTVGGSTNTNQVVITIDPAQPAVFLRLLYP